MFACLFCCWTRWVNWFSINVHVSLLLKLYGYLRICKWTIAVCFYVLICYSPQAQWILLNNPLDFVSGIIQQYSLRLRRIIVKCSRIFSSFSWGIFGHLTCLAQSRASENICWIIILYIFHSSLPLFGSLNTFIYFLIIGWFYDYFISCSKKKAVNQHFQWCFYCRLVRVQITPSLGRRVVLWRILRDWPGTRENLNVWRKRDNKTLASI